MSQTALCRISGKEFTISDGEIEACRRFQVPLPTLCPEERIRSLMAFRNEWKLYPRKCDATDEEILSAYKPGVPFPVYKNEVWWGDSWDGVQYGREFDFSRSFFEQLKELQNVVPREGTSVFNSENCTFNGHIRQSKNCYLNSLVTYCEDVYYSYWMVKDKDVYDSIYTNDSTLCYECRDVNNGYNCFLLEESNNCRDCFFSYELRGCNNCIFSSNLVNKSYHIFNKPCTKEEFETMKGKLLNGSWATWQKTYREFLNMRQKAVHKNVHVLNSENVRGDHLYDCKNCLDCYDSFGSEDCCNVISMTDSKDVYNAYSAGWSRCELVYDCVVSRGATDIAFCSYTFYSNNLRYGDSCINSKDCFGCIGLRHKQYCILNKQYTKEEYEALVPKIIEHMKKTGEWGEFFPGFLSPFGYNETAAQDYFPLEKKEALALGFSWSDYELPKPQVEKTIPAARLPDNIKDIPDDILNWAIECEVTHKPFRIVKQELKFYREHHLPIPRRHPYERHMERMALRNPRNLWNRRCSQCQKEMQTSYAPERKETVYCEECYLKEIY